jgi:tetratricopeptide (TPR) repeat protein
MGYAVAHLDEIDELLDGRCPYRPVRLHFGITSFGVTTWTAGAAGDRIINEHDEYDAGSDEELFPYRSEANGVRRGARDDDHRARRHAEPRGWELWAPLVPLYEAGEYTELADRLRVLVEAPPRYALLLYNLACCESLTGRAADALDHLRQAIDMTEQFRGFAKDDSDFDPIRDDPAFGQLIGD